MVFLTLEPRVLARTVELACHAPSVHNSQPWRWVDQGPDLMLFRQSKRVPDATDLTGREAMISCGAALNHLLVASAAEGLQANVSRFPNPNDPDHLATISFSPMRFVTDAHRARADAILRRRTDRMPFAPPPNWAEFERILRSTVDTDLALLHVLPQAVRPRLAEASRLTESLRRYDTSYHSELAWWTAPLETRDGVPQDTLISAADRGRVDIARNFPVGENPDTRPEIGHDRSTIMVLSTYSDSHREAFGCGEVLSTVLLEATMAGLATCTLSHMTELDASREIVRSLVGGSLDPQLLIRIGWVPEISPPPPPTPRRPLSEVLDLRS